MEDSEEENIPTHKTARHPPICDPGTFYDLVLSLLENCHPPIQTERELLNFLWDCYLQGDFIDYSPDCLYLWLDCSSYTDLWYSVIFRQHLLATVLCPTCAVSQHRFFVTHHLELTPSVSFSIENKRNANFTITALHILLHLHCKPCLTTCLGQKQSTPLR